MTLRHGDLHLYRPVARLTGHQLRDGARRPGVFAALLAPATLSLLATTFTPEGTVQGVRHLQRGRGQRRAWSCCSAVR